MVSPKLTLSVAPAFALKFKPFCASVKALLAVLCAAFAEVCALLALVKAVFAVFCAVVTLLLVVVNWLKLTASPGAVPAARLVIFWLFKFAPPFKLLTPVTLNVPPVARFPAVTVPENVGASAIWISTVFPVMTVLTFAFEPVPARPPVIFNVDPSLLVELPALALNIIALFTAVSKPESAAPTLFTLPVFVPAFGSVVTL